MKNSETMYMDNAEWLAQKYKVVAIEKRIEALEQMYHGSAIFGEVERELRLKIQGHRLARNQAYVKLKAIEAEIEADYNLRAVASRTYYVTYKDEDYFKDLIDKDGYIKGIKF